MSIQSHTAALFERILRRMQPTEDIDLAAWADKYRRLPAESSAEPGKWKTSRTPYLRKPMMCLTEPEVREVIMMTSVQVGKSELLLNAMGYYAHIEPSAILLTQPTVLTGKDFSKERIAPTIRDTPVLRPIIGGEKSRDAKNTVQKKFFPGGYIAIVGANSPVGLASRPIRVLLCDEIDRWPESAKKEGDPLSIVEKRTSTYPYTKKMVKVSTPTNDGESRIQHEFRRGSMERWKLPCPGCGEYQELLWANIRFDHIRDEGTGALKKDGDVLCECPSCGELNDELTWKRGDGEWFADAENDTVKSFHLSALVSPWMSWREIVKEFLSSKGDRELMKVWTNTVLGETWCEAGETVEWPMLLDRRIKYNALVPENVLVITAGVDVQHDRLELEIVGWCENKVSYGIEYKVIIGNTTSPETWERLDQHLRKQYNQTSGHVLPIACTCIDSGDGARATEVYEFCKDKELRNVYAVKGRGGAGMSIIHTYSRTKKVKNVLVIVAVDTAKDVLFTRLNEADEKKAGYCYFPAEDDFERGYTEKYFEGLTAETKVTKMVKGRPITEWKPKTGVRNEPLDCRVYNIAAIEILNPNFEELKKRKGMKAPKKKRRRGTISKGISVD